MKKGYTYILASKKNGTIYVGVTSDLYKRIYQHKYGKADSFTYKYNIKTLVYYEEHVDIKSAIEREKFIKGKSRKYKLDLIEKDNNDWVDLCKGWYDDED
jgi:putative endonuclease